MTLLVAGCGVTPTNSAAPIATAPTATKAGINGVVHGGQQPVGYATMQLYTVGTSGDGSSSTPMLTQTVLTDGGGGFSITGDYSCTNSNATQVYLTATGGQPAANTTNGNLALMVALGPCSALTPNTNVSINELTTVAAVAALQPYMTGPTAVGSGASDAAGLAAAFALAGEFVSTASGTSPGINVPSGYEAPYLEINTLGDVIAGCINSPGGHAGQSNACGNLFTLTTVNNVAPADTITALLHIAGNPALNTTQLFDSAPTTAPFLPTLSVAPANFQIALQATTAITPTAALSVSPGSLAFGTLGVGDLSSEQTVTVFNGGTTPVTLASASFTGVNAADFTYAGGSCGSTLAAGAACTVEVTATPGGVGSRSGHLIVASNAPGSPQSVALSATGTAAAFGTASGGLGLTLVEPLPPMGWSTYPELFVSNIPNGAWQPSQAAIDEQAAALTSTGLQALGYNLISVDAGWQQRDSAGNLEGIPALYPNGIPGLVADLHGKGFKVGLYGSPASVDCLNAPGQRGHEVADATTLVAWNIDYFKHDLCLAISEFGATSTSLEVPTALFGNVLAEGGVALYVSYYYGALGNYDDLDTLQWFQSAGGTSLRVANDNEYGPTPWYNKAFSPSTSMATTWPTLQQYQSKGHWMDPDAMLFQLAEGSPAAVMGDVEGRTMFNWYSIIAAPLIIGPEITHLTPTTLETLSNAEVIAVDQDALGVMGYMVSSTTCGSTTCQVWVRQLANGWAVCLFNPDPTAAHTVSVTWSMFGQGGTTFNMRDLWVHAGVGSSSSGYTATAIPAWGSVMLLLTQ